MISGSQTQDASHTSHPRVPATDPAATKNGDWDHSRRSAHPREPGGLAFKGDAWIAIAEQRHQPRSKREGV